MHTIRGRGGNAVVPSDEGVNNPLLPPQAASSAPVHGEALPAAGRPCTNTSAGPGQGLRQVELQQLQRGIHHHHHQQQATGSGHEQAAVHQESLAPAGAGAGVEGADRQHQQLLQGPVHSDWPAPLVQRSAPAAASQVGQHFQHGMRPHSSSRSSSGSGGGGGACGSAGGVALGEGVVDECSAEAAAQAAGLLHKHLAASGARCTAPCAVVHSSCTAVARPTMARC